MDFLFFDAANHMLFARSDAESAHWVQEEMSVNAVFPFDPGKVLTRGLRLGFVDPDTLLFEVFEIRNVQNIEPDHYQQIKAEHIVIADLSDDHIDNQEITNQTPADALTAVLTGTLWAVGNVTASNASSCDISRGSVWDAVNVIQQNWNVYIVPRVTRNETGITGRYLDVMPAGGTYRGLRLSIDKNMSDSAVTYDDTDVLTALFGYGGSVSVPHQGGEDTAEQLTFENVVWTQTAAHPAKPAGQKYIEWPEKTALYGRNGRPRYGYYQNSDITDAETLLQKTWEQLQATCEPKISITGTVTDLKRLGYVDAPMRLHDVAQIEISQTGEIFRREIIRLDVDLLDPSATMPEIGDYIPNIVYIQRRTEEQATGGGGGGGGGRGQTKLEAELKETYTAWEKSDERIGMIIGTVNGGYYVKAGEIALAINKSGQTGQYESTALINADHVRMAGTQNVYTLAGDLFHDANGDLVIKSAGGLYVEKTEQGVTSTFGVWDENSLTGGIIVQTINGDTQLTLKADKIDIQGVIAAIEASAGWFTQFDGYNGEFTGNLTVDGILESLDELRAADLSCATLSVDGQAYEEKNFVHKTYTLSGHYFLYAADNTSHTPTGSVNGYVITGESSTTIYYLGR